MSKIKGAAVFFRDYGLSHIIDAVLGWVWGHSYVVAAVNAILSLIGAAGEMPLTWAYATCLIIFGATLWVINQVMRFWLMHRPSASPPPPQDIPTSDVIPLREAMQAAYEATEEDMIAAWAEREKSPLAFYANLVKQHFSLEGRRPLSRVPKPIAVDEQKKLWVSDDCHSLGDLFGSKAHYTDLSIRRSDLGGAIAYLKTFDRVFG